MLCGFRSKVTVSVSPVNPAKSISEQTGSVVCFHRNQAPET